NPADQRRPTILFAAHQAPWVRDRRYQPGDVFCEPLPVGGFVLVVLCASPAGFLGQDVFDQLEERGGDRETSGECGSEADAPFVPVRYRQTSRMHPPATPQGTPPRRICRKWRRLFLLR